MRSVVRFFTAGAILLLFAGCSMHHMQTPDVLPKGKVAGGIGIGGLAVGGFPVPMPGFWVRTGVAPNFDVGIKPWFLGMEVDGKYSFSDYFAVGGGVGFAFPLVFLFSAEGSLYGGIPIGEVLYPYGVVRGRIVGGATAEIDILGDNVSAAGSRVSGVLGLRLRFGESFSIYGEGGAGLPIAITGSGGVGDPGFIFGIGATVGY